MTTPTGRLVWLDSGTVVAMNQALVDADQRGVNERWLTWNLGAVVAAFDAAPADPARALEDAADLYFQEHGSEGTIDGANRALLAALGVPSEASS